MFLRERTPQRPRHGIGLLACVLLWLSSGAVARDIRACTSIFYPYVYAKTRPDGAAAALGDNETLYGQDMSLALFNELFTGLDVQLITALALNTLDAGAGGANNLTVRLHSSFTNSLYEARGEVCDLAIGAYIKDSTRLTCDDRCSRQPGLSSPGQATEVNICCLEFSSVYSRSGNAVVTKMQLKKTATARAILDNIVSWNFINLMSVLTIGLLVSGHLIWIVERGSNKKQFPTGYLDGVDDGLWWSIVTMTTVGYGDKAPMTMLGRFIGVIWMFIGLAVFGLFSGLISSSLTANAIARTANSTMSIADLRRPGLGPICTVHGSYYTFLTELDIKENPTMAKATVEECIQGMVEDDVNAIYFDKIGLMTFTNNKWHDGQRQSTGDGGDGGGGGIPLLTQFEEGVTIGPILATVNYAIAFPTRSSLREEINQGIARLEGGELVFSNEFSPFIPGWSLGSARQEFIYSHITMDEMYGVREVSPHATMESAGDDPTLLIVTLCLTSVYLMVQFGGLWLRRHKKAINKIFHTNMHSQRSLSLSREPSLESLADVQELGALIWRSCNEIQAVRDDIKVLVNVRAQKQPSQGHGSHSKPEASSDLQASAGDLGEV